MDDDSLLAFIEQQESRARRPETAAEQARAMDYYLGKQLGNEEEGRSSVVSSDVWDVVEGLTPQVLKPFVGDDDVVRFQPVGPEDEEAAEQETDYVNFVVTQRNDLFEQLVAWVKAGLLLKNGIAKYWWEQSRRSRIETFEGLSDDIYTDLTSDPNVTVLEHTATGEGNEATHDAKLRFADPTGCVKFAVIPPEELLVSIDARSPNPKQAPFIEHRTLKTLSALREMGYKVDDDIEDSGPDPTTEEQAAARMRNGQMGASDGQGDPSMREVTYREVYAFVDVDGDGIAEPRKVCVVGKTILANDEVEEWPFAGWTPYLQLFQFDGRCPADETIEIQEVKTTLWRQGLDNIYTINNNRTFVSEKVNMDDMLDNQIAGIVRVNGDIVGNHVQQMGITPIGQVIQPMIEYLDAAKETRTGFTRANQGSSDLGNQKTLGEIQIVAEAGNERVGLISRAFAEQGLKPLMIGVHGLLRKHATKAETIRLRGRWIEVDPRSWQSRYDMTVSVGLGTADKRTQLQAHQMLLAEQKELSAVPGLVSPQNFFNSGAQLTKLVGEKDPGKYFSDPSKQAQASLPPEVQQTLQQAAQEIQMLQQHIQELESGVAVKRMEMESKQQIEAMKQQDAERDRQLQAFMQQMKDAAAYDREELKGVIALIQQQAEPPPELAEDVASDVTKSN